MLGERRWWPDLAAGVLAVAFGFVNALLSRPSWETGTSDAAMVLANVGAAVLVAGARRWPVPFVLAECVVLVIADSAVPFGTDTAQAAAIVGLGAVAHQHRWPATVAALAVTYAATIVNIVDPGNEGVLSGAPGAVRLVLVAALATAPIAFGKYLRGVRLAAGVARDRVREAESMRAVESRAARLAERAAIASGQPDILAHHVGAIALRAGTAQYALRGGGHTGDGIEALGDIRTNAVHVLEELKSLLLVLRDPGAVDASPAVVEPEHTIGEMVRQVRASGLEVAADVSETLTDTPLVVRTTAARVAQEGLTNALKHAGPGASAQISIDVDQRDVTVLVTDSGPRGGKMPLPCSGHGLAGMRERVALLGGTLTAGPDDNGGWRLRARLPLGGAA